MSSNADKMFEDLGYEWNMLVSVANGKQWGIAYKNPKKLVEIAFDYEDKEICTSCFETYEPIYINMQELQAINEKCKELRLARLGEIMEIWKDIKRIH